MANLQTMYPGVANSPNTFLKEALAKDATVMYLSDGSVLGTLPTLAVIGGGADAETVLVTSTAADGGFTIERGVEGKQQAWKKADPVARNWTNKDYETIRANVTAINDGKVDKATDKGLSSNDYDNAAKAKVDGIPENPKYTDTIPDLTPYAKKTDIKTRLADMTEDSEHRTVTDTEKKEWDEKLSLDKQYLFDILMGESLVTKKAGEWPVVHGKPMKIEAKSFKEAQLVSVTIPTCVNQIAGSAFDGNQLTSVVIPPSVTAIGPSAFQNNKLTSVVIPPNVTFIGPGAFAANQLTSVVIPPGVTSLQWYMFMDNLLTSVVIPPNVTEIEDGVFMNNQLMSVVIPPGVTVINDEAFQNNKLTEVRVPANCTVADGAFDAGVNIIRY